MEIKLNRNYSEEELKKLLTVIDPSMVGNKKFYSVISAGIASCLSTCDPDKKAVSLTVSDDGKTVIMYAMSVPEKEERVSAIMLNRSQRGLTFTIMLHDDGVLTVERNSSEHLTELDIRVNGKRKETYCNEYLLQIYDSQGIERKQQTITRVSPNRKNSDVVSPVQLRDGYSPELMESSEYVFYNSKRRSKYSPLIVEIEEFERAFDGLDAGPKIIRRKSLGKLHMECPDRIRVDQDDILAVGDEHAYVSDGQLVNYKDIKVNTDLYTLSSKLLGYLETIIERGRQENKDVSILEDLEAECLDANKRGRGR